MVLLIFSNMPTFAAVAESEQLTWHAAVKPVLAPQFGMSLLLLTYNAYNARHGHVQHGLHDVAMHIVGVLSVDVSNVGVYCVGVHGTDVPGVGVHKTINFSAVQTNTYLMHI